MSNHKTKAHITELLSKERDTKWRDETTYRQANKAWLKKSARIAIRINTFLRENKMTQKSLAAKLDVSPQQVNKILKGHENLTLETISRIEEALGMELVTIITKKEMRKYVAEQIAG